MGMIKKIGGLMALKKMIEQRRERRRRGGNMGQPMPGRGGKDRKSHPIDKGPIYGAR